MEGDLQDWRAEKSSLRKSFGYMFDNGLCSDITFLVGAEESEIYAHKFVLIARSEPLATMIKWTSATEQKIKLPEDNPTAVKHFMKFLYTDRISFDLEIKDILEITGLAHMYQVNKLFGQCIAHLTANISEKNCLQIYKSCKFSDESLSDKALQLFLANVVATAKSNDAYLTWDYETLELILKDDREHVPESLLFKALLKWRNEDSGRNEEFQKLSRLIRFPTMSAKEFATEVVTSESGVLSKDETVEVFTCIASQTGSVQFPSERRKLLVSTADDDPRHLKICGSPSAVDVDSFLRRIEYSSFHNFNFRLTMRDPGHSFRPADVKLYGVKFFNSAGNNELLEFFRERRFSIRVTLDEWRGYGGSGRKILEKTIPELDQLQMRAYFNSPLIISRNQSYSIATSLTPEAGIGAYFRNADVRFQLKLPQLLSPCHQNGLKLDGGMKLTIEHLDGPYPLIDALLFAPPNASAEDCSDCKIA